MSKAGPLIGLAGVIIAAMSVELNGSVSSLALPDITGSLGISHDAGLWFTSLYSSGEVLGMTLGAWWAVTVTLRRFALFAIAFACIVTVLIPLSGNLAWLYGMRVLQGLATGFTIPLLITAALRALGPPIRLYGLACYALTATLFPNLSASLAGLWTDYIDWHFVFLQAVPLDTLAFLLVWQGMPEEQPKYERLRQFDWRGALLVAAGFGSLTTLLVQGDRVDWFHARWICVLALVSAVCIPLFLLNEWFHPLPLLKLQLLARRNFAYGCVALVTFVVITVSASTIPIEYLQQVQGYRPLDAQMVTAEIALLQIILLPAMAVILNIAWVDARWVSFVGLCCILAACIGDSYLDSDWNRVQFYGWQVLQAVGEAAVVMPLLMMSTNAVKPEEGPLATANVNAPRAVGEAVSTWLLTLITRLRGHFHSDRIADQLGLERFGLIQGQGSLRMYPGPLLPSGAPRTPSSLRTLNGVMQQQTAVLTLSDAFLVIAALTVVLMIVLWVLTERTYPPRIALAKQ